MLCRDIEAGRAFARRLRDERGVQPDGWVAFIGEYQPDEAEKLFLRLRHGEVVLRSNLEEELAELSQGSDFRVHRLAAERAPAPASR